MDKSYREGTISKTKILRQWCEIKCEIQKCWNRITII